MITNKTIYLVDDDADDRMLIGDAIRSAINNVKIVEFTDGEDLLKRMETQSVLPHPALIMMDMNMPKINGLEALIALKSNNTSQHIPIIMTSTTSNPHLINQAYKEGVSAFMTKPSSLKGLDYMANAINACFISRIPAMSKMTVTNSFSTSSILFIEDNPDHWELMHLAIKRCMPDIKLTGMRNKESTLNLLNSQDPELFPLPNLVLLDLYLPTRKDGLDLLDALRNIFIARKANIPIVIFSSSNNEEDIKACYRHKANCYMVKSADMNQWFDYFKKLCDFWWGPITLPGSPPLYNNLSRFNSKFF